MRGDPWTDSEMATLREHYGTMPTPELAAKLKRTVPAVKSRAKVLRLGRRNWWTEAERQILRDNYAKMTGEQLAELTGHSLSSVFQQAAKLGLRKWPSIDQKKIAMIPKLHAKGLSDREIAERLGIDRRYVNELRVKRFKLTVNEEGSMRGRHLAVKKQLQTLGLDSPTQLRSRAFRLYALENGWPDDFRPREVQILNALATHGPMTAEQIAEKIGMRTDLVNCVHGGKKLLSGCNRKRPNGSAYGTYTASLMERGMIVYIHRSSPSGRRGHGRIQGLYMLTAAAIEIIARNQEVA